MCCGVDFPSTTSTASLRKQESLFGDDAHIIYVNSQIKDETALGKLMHDFTCTDPDDMNYPVLAQRVRYFKEDTKGVTTMCKAMEEMRAEERKEQLMQKL